MLHLIRNSTFSCVFEELFKQHALGHRTDIILHLNWIFCLSNWANPTSLFPLKLLRTEAPTQFIWRFVYVLLFYHAERNNSLSLCSRWQPSIRAFSAAGFTGGDGAVRAAVLIRHRSCLCFGAEERRKSKGRKWILFTLLVKCQGVQPVSGDNEGPYHLLIEIQWGVKEAFKKNSQSTGPSRTATTRESNFILTSLPLVKDPSLPIMAWDWVSRRASVCSSIQPTLNRCYTLRIYTKTRNLC